MLNWISNKVSKFGELFQSYINLIFVNTRFALVSHTKMPTDDNTIISLTSYTPRFGTLGPTLKSLAMQSVAPKFIVLWIEPDHKQYLPTDVLKLAKKGIIRIMESEDLGPGKKILPALKAFPDYNVVTADDDIYYPPKWFESLLTEMIPQEKTVIAHRVHKVGFDQAGKLTPYDDWEQNYKTSEKSYYLFATGVGGVLYPKGCFSNEVLNIRNYKECCMYQDDIWLFFMEKINNVEVKKTKIELKLTPWFSSKSVGLNKINCHGENDVAIMNLQSKYGPIGIKPNQELN